MIIKKTIGKYKNKNVYLVLSIEEKVTEQLNYETLEKVVKSEMYSIRVECCNQFYGSIEGCKDCFTWEKGLTFADVSILDSFHLNDLKAGTKKQTDFINANIKQYDYNIVCKKLKEAGIYIDNGYKYGSAWLFQVITQEEKQQILKIMEEI